MAEAKGGIRINGALVAALLTERPGYKRDAAITLGRGAAGSSARVKAIGVAGEQHEARRR